MCSFSGNVRQRLHRIVPLSGRPVHTQAPSAPPCQEVSAWATVVPVTPANCPR